MHQLWFPTRLLFGEGALAGLGKQLPALGRKALLVTGGTATAGMPAVALIREMLRTLGGDCIHFAEVEADPDVETVERGAALGAAEGVDLVIGLGGGSPLDAAKAIAARLTNDGPASAFFGAGNITEAPLPLVCIPTTSGTGSEATQIAVLTDTDNRRKMSVVSPLLYPALSIVDPELTVSMSPTLMAGMAFSHAGLGLAHALAHPLGALFGVPHGLANAVMLPAVMEFNSEEVPEAYRELAFLSGSNAASLEPREAVGRAVAAVRDLFAAVQLPATISACGVNEEHIPLLAAEAMLNKRLRASNPRASNLEQIEGIYRNCL